MSTKQVQFLGNGCANGKAGPILTQEQNFIWWLEAVNLLSARCELLIVLQICVVPFLSNGFRCTGSNQVGIILPTRYKLLHELINTQSCTVFLFLIIVWLIPL